MENFKYIAWRLLKEIRYFLLIFLVIYTYNEIVKPMIEERDVEKCAQK